MIALWLEPLWQRLLADPARLPHALLFAGPSGVGKRDLADALAARLLCESPRADGHACGACTSCIWRKAGTHPDAYRIEPEAEEEGAIEAAAGQGGRKPSRQIRIEQVRAVQTALASTGTRSSRRVVLIDPAEAMNTSTANALLKLLEEPPAGCIFLLLSDRPRTLLPTIRSRCQVWAVPRPDAKQALDWLAGKTPGCTEDLLALCGGLPLAAQRLAERGGVQRHQRFVREISLANSNLSAAPEPLRLAEQWESWLKDKQSVAEGFDLPLLANWMLRWVSDLLRVRMGLLPHYFPAAAPALESLAARISVGQALSCYNRLAHFVRAAAHPLNLRLFLEDMLMHYFRTFGGPAR